jgi:hypothetical protein
VANRNEGTVSIFTISGNKLSATGKIDFGDPKSGPSGVLAQSMVDNALAVVSFNGKSLKVTGQLKVTGGPDGIPTAGH